MAKTAGTVLDTILARIRGAGGVAHTDAIGLDILSKCQRMANLFLRSQVTSASFALTASQALYAISSVSASTTDIVDIVYANKTLARIPNAADLGARLGHTFYADTGDTPVAWCPLGRTHFLIYPKPTAPAPSVTVTYVNLLTILDGRSDNLEVSDEEAAFVARLGELTLLARQRSVAEAKEVLKGLIEDLKMGGGRYK